MKSAALLASVVAISLVGGMASNVMFQTNGLNPDDLAEFKACLEVVKREGQFSDLATPGKLLRLYARDGGERVQVGTYSGHRGAPPKACAPPASAECAAVAYVLG